ncbi:hypothetical protein [Citrobacter phage Tr1]|nr:hypothetical protein [Citrobacter phage Tr1]
MVNHQGFEVKPSERLTGSQNTLRLFKHFLPV